MRLSACLYVRIQMYASKAMLAGGKEKVDERYRESERSKENRQTDNMMQIKRAFAFPLAYANFFLSHFLPQGTFFHPL